MENLPIIRNATPEDIPAITDIYAESVLNAVASYEIDPPGVDTMRQRYDSGCAAGFPWLVVNVENTIAGYAYASPFRPRPGYRWLVEDSVYFYPQMRKRGLGLMILNRLIEECTALGFRQMTAVIGGAQAGSIALHRKAGFTEAGCIKASGFKFGRWLDTTLMQRPLGEGSTTLPDRL
jgi:L-amino acid N-acyltransferase YncA